LIGVIGTTYSPLTQEWAWNGKSAGWSMRLRRLKRAVLYMGAREGWFLVAFAFGERAVEAALASDLPDAAKAIVRAAPKYPEARAVRVEVRSVEDLDVVVRLAALKMAN